LPVTFSFFRCHDFSIVVEDHMRPQNQLGEGSIALATNLNINSEQHGPIYKTAPGDASPSPGA
jgi:hypothetical protein